MRNASQVRKSIKAICRSATKLQEQVHGIAVECLEHIREHGNVTLLADLCNELPKGQRRDAIKLWAVHFCGGLLKAKGDADTGYSFGMAAKWMERRVEIRVDDYKVETETGPETVQGARSVPYYAFSVENKPAPAMDIEGLVKKLAAWAASKPREDGTVRVTPEAQEAAKLAAAFLADKFSLDK